MPQTFGELIFNANEPTTAELHDAARRIALRIADKARRYMDNEDREMFAAVGYEVAVRELKAFTKGRSS